MPDFAQIAWTLPMPQGQFHKETYIDIKNHTDKIKNNSLIGAWISKQTMKSTIMRGISDLYVVYYDNFSLSAFMLPENLTRKNLQNMKTVFVLFAFTWDFNFQNDE